MMTSTTRKFAVGIASLAMLTGLTGPAMAADLSANREAGADRYDTAIAVAEKAFKTSAVVYVARGDVLVDAVTAGSLKGGPLLLVNDNKSVQDKVSAAIRKLGASKVVVIGGEKAVSKETVTKIAPAGVTLERIEGKDRFDTAVQIAKAYQKQLKEAGTPGEFKTVYLANGLTLVDALAGGQLTDGPILLTDGADKLPAPTAKELNEIGGSKGLTALGGTKAVSDAVLQAGAVAQTILVDSYVQENRAAVEAAAKANLDVDGYVTAAPGVTLEKAVKASPTAAELAEVRATWPKVNVKLANSSGDLFSVKGSDGKITAKDLSAAKGAASNTVVLKDGTAALSYAGTTLALVAANTAAKAYTVIDLSQGSQLFNSTPASVNVATTDLNTGEGNLTYAAVEKNWPGEFKGTDTIAVFLNTIGVPLPANGTQYQAGEVTAANAAFNAAQAAAKTTLDNELSKAATANTKALKAQTKANKRLAEVSTPGSINANANRLAGADRYETAVKIAEKVYGDKGSDKGRVYFANGTAFADAAVSGMLDNSNNGGPILLVTKDSVPASSATYAKDSDKRAFIARDRIIALGGTAVISDKNLLDEMNVLAPESDTKNLSISYGPAVVAGGDSSATKNNGVPVVATGQNVTIKVKPVVSGAPNGSSQVYSAQMRVGSTGPWTDAGKELAVGSKKVTLAVASQSDGVQVITVSDDGAAGADASKPAEAVKIEVRLVGSVQDTNGTTLGSAEYSAATVLYASTKN